jgi:hypothetical protein
MRESVTLTLDEKTIAAAKEKAAANDRSLVSYLEQVVTKEIHASDASHFSVLAPENVRESEPVRFPDDTDKEFERRNNLLSAILDVSGH